MAIIKRVDFTDRTAYSVQREDRDAAGAGIPESDTFTVVTDPVTPFVDHTGTGRIQVHQGYSPFGWNESTEPVISFGNDIGGPTKMQAGAEHWFAWAFRVPSGWERPHGFGLALQFYSIVDSAPFSGGPSIDVGVRALGTANPNTETGWYVGFKTGEGPSVSHGLIREEHFFDLAADTWYRCVFNIKWSPWGRANSLGQSNTEPVTGIYQRAGVTTNGSPTVTLTPDVDETAHSMSRIEAGMGVSGTGIPADTTVLSVNSTSSITLSANASATGSRTLTFTCGPGHFFLWVKADGDEDFAPKVNEPDFPTLQRVDPTKVTGYSSGRGPAIIRNNHTDGASPIKFGLYRKSRCKTQKEATGSGPATQIGPLKAGAKLSTSPTANRCFYGAWASAAPSTIYQGGLLVCTTEAEAFAAFDEDGTPPSQVPNAVTNLSATAGDTEVDLSWTNPASLDAIHVRRATGAYPATVTDGTEVLNGTGTSVNDDGLTNDTEYFYSVFTELGGLFSSAAQVTATPTSGGGGETGTNPTLLADFTAVAEGDERYGNTDIYGTLGQLSANRTRLTKITVTEETDIHTLWYWVEGFASGTEDLKLLVYDDDGTGGEPGTLLIESDELAFGASPFNGGLLKYTVSPAVELGAGEYWCGCQSETGGVLVQAQEAFSGASRSQPDTYSDGPADPAASMAVFDSRFTFAIEGTPTGDGGTVVSGDATAPAVVAARSSVSGSLVELAYDEALDEDSTPATSAFVVTADGSSQPISSVLVNGASVFLFMAASLLTGSDVTVDYTAGGSPIQDLAGNDAANLSDQEVTNRTQDLQTARRPGAFRTVDPTGRVEGERRVGEGGGG